MEDYVKSTKQKIQQLEKEISKSVATDHEKRNMQHTLSKVNIFSDDVFDEAKYYKKRSDNLLKFAEWVNYEAWTLKEMDVWVNKNYPSLEERTTQQLYKVFIEAHT